MTAKERVPRKDSFPRSCDEDTHPHRSPDGLRGKVVAMLHLQVASQARMAQLQKRAAFDRLLLNRQSYFMEHLLADNESLLDQVQTLQMQIS